MKISEVDRTKLSPMMAQYMEIKDKYKEELVFYRLGDFYEMFFDDALIASRELELTLTGRVAGLEEKVPMCGVPHNNVKPYIEKLVNKGYRVAICEQLEDPRFTKGMVKRGIVDVISKGTIADNDLLNDLDSSYIASILFFSDIIVLTILDISTGYLATLSIENDEEKLINEILEYNLKEVIFIDNLNTNLIDLLKNTYGIEVTISSEFLWDKYKNLLDTIEDARVKNGIAHLFYYLDIRQLKDLSHINKINYIKKNNYLEMDIHSIRNLELIETLRLKERTYSLLWLLDKTKTAMGSRMLKNWIENPLVDKNEINKRYDIVEKLETEFILKEELREYLYQVYDLERLCGRIGYGNTNGRDLLQLKNSLKVLPNIKSILDNLKYEKTIETLDDLYELLQNSIDEDAPVTIKEGGIIKSGFNLELDELKENRSSGKDFVIKMESEERNRTGIKNLKVGYNKIFGYYIEVSKSNIGLIKEEYNYIRKQTLANCERYVTPLLKEKEALILGAEEKIINLEYNLFIEIKNKVQTYIKRIQNIAKVIAEIDVLQSFATISEENNYIRPIITDKRIVEIIDNRHPVVEKVLETPFVPNDILMDEKTNILIITGPNMAGKSTYMREFAITVIMAQIGCFVPAKKCTLPIFDQIFTRIGASDDLVSGDSTFMVEMKEANEAITNATNNSLIIFDELGRGTATYDGLSLAQAIIEYIHNNIKCKTLFSTHYHELTKLEDHFENLKNVHVSALEENGNITFLHKIKNGSVDKSYGIHVAKLANLPKSLIKRANEILNDYESNGNIEIKNQISFDLDEKDEENIALEKLKKINPYEITPIEALNILYELKKDVDNNK